LFSLASKPFVDRYLQRRQAVTWDFRATRDSAWMEAVPRVLCIRENEALFSGEKEIIQMRMGMMM